MHLDSNHSFRGMSYGLPALWIKSADFSRVLAGPFAGRMLSDWVLMWLKLSRQREMSCF